MDRTQSTTRHRFASAQRRGSIYVAVLGAASLVALIGVGAVAAARIQLRAAVAANDATHAAPMAQSAIELARLRIANDANWRTSFTHDRWTENVPFTGGGSISFKLIDEADSDLSDSGSEPVRLIGRGVYGKSLRMMSVELTPDFTGKMTPTPGSWRQEVLP